MHFSRFVVRAPVDLVFVFSHVLTFFFDLASSDKDIVGKLLTEALKFSIHLHHVLLIFGSSLRPYPLVLPPMLMLFLQFAPLWHELRIMMSILFLLLII